MIITYDKDGWEIDIDVSVSGVDIPASMEEPEECPEIEWVISYIGKYGSFDDVDDDTLENFVYSEYYDLKERGPDL